MISDPANLQSRNDLQTAVSNAPTLVPLCIDLDGTLIATDSMWEAFLLLVKKRPLDLFRFPSWIAKGRAYFKDELFKRVMPDVTLFPYRQDILDLASAHKQAGGRLVLATGSDQRMGRAVAEHLGIFDDIVASDGVTNMTSHRKLAELERHFGVGGFDYAGNSSADLCLWAACGQSYVVAAPAGVKRRAQKQRTPSRVFDYPDSGMKAAFRAIRPYQWVKNLLLFLALILAHKVEDWHRFQAAVFAFWAFSFCASAVYVCNDLLDLESDRRHKSKRRRPFAAGLVPVPVGLMMAAGLLIASFAIALILPHKFLALLAIYLILTTLYSFWLKRKMLVDVIVLAGLYTHRIVAGAAAVDVPMTMWLLAFSMFFFLSLAFVKRYSELLEAEDAGREAPSGRGYCVTDLRIIESVGPASGYLSVMVFCNYLDLPSTRNVYPRWHLLWLVAPILLYWITRVWFIARRRALHDDPIVFAIRDRISYGCGLLAAVIVYLAAHNWWPRI